MKFLCTLAAVTMFTQTLGLCDEKKSEPDKNKVEAKTKEVNLKGLKLRVPETWKTQKSSSNMRLATYALPKIDGDTDDAELTIFSFGGGGGGVEANVSRWIGQFASEGRKSRLFKGKAGENEYYFADISGTYNKPDGPPFLRKTKRAPGYRMLGVILATTVKQKTDDGQNADVRKVFFLKLTGPEKTVAAHAKAYRASFGGSEKAEEEMDLDE